MKAHRDIKFMYVNTKGNPADVATRGNIVYEPNNGSLSWYGPKW